MNNRNRLALLGIAVLFAIPLLIISQRETPPESTTQPARTLADKRLTRPIVENQVLEENSGERQPLYLESTSLAIPLSAAEIRILEDRLNELTKLCREIERSNATLIVDKEYAIGRLIAFKIEHPSASDASKIYAAVASARESLPDTPNLRREFERLSDSLVSAYYDFARQLKYVYLRESNRTDIPITLTELYLTHGDKLTISDKGSVSYRADAPSRSDDKWGTAKSWASKRYSHLFSSEETRDSQVSP